LKRSWKKFVLAFGFEKRTIDKRKATTKKKNNAMLMHLHEMYCFFGFVMVNDSFGGVFVSFSGACVEGFVYVQVVSQNKNKTKHVHSNKNNCTKIEVKGIR